MILKVALLVSLTGPIFVFAFFSPSREWTARVDATVFADPLVVPGSKDGRPPLLIVATMANSIYAFDIRELVRRLISVAPFPCHAGLTLRACFPFHFVSVGR